MSSRNTIRTTIDVDSLKAQIDFVALASTWLNVSRSGARYVAKCPFHERDRNPSFIIYPDHGFCFSCRKNADAIEMVQHFEGLDFLGAVAWLAERVGDMPMLDHDDPYFSGQYEYPDDPIPQDTIYYWHNSLTSELRAYYHERCLTDITIDTFKLGWDGWAYVTPIWEGVPGQSECYSAKMRRLDGNGPKYYNLKGRGAPRLFNQYVLDGADIAYIFIGEYDTMLAHQDGFTAVTGTGGQANWLPEWNQKFLGCDKIHIIPDVGEVTSGFVIASQLGTRATVHTYPVGTGSDYTDFRRNYPVDAFHTLVLEPVVEEIEEPEVETFWANRNT